MGEVNTKNYSRAFLCLLALMAMAFAGSRASLAATEEVAKPNKRQIAQIRKLLEVLPSHWGVFVYAVEQDDDDGPDIRIPVCLPGTAVYDCTSACPCPGGDDPAQVLGAEGSDTETCSKSCVCTTTCDGTVGSDGSCNCSTTREDCTECS